MEQNCILLFETLITINLLFFVLVDLEEQSIDVRTKLVLCRVTLENTTIMIKACEIPYEVLFQQ